MPPLGAACPLLVRSPPPDQQRPYSSSHQVCKDCTSIRSKAVFAGIHIFGSLAASTARSTDLRPAVQADDRFLWFNFSRQQHAEGLNLGVDEIHERRYTRHALHVTMCQQEVGSHEFRPNIE